MWYLYSTLEIVAVATSNSHIVFCFCNLIIAVLLIGNTTSSTFIDHPPLTDSDAEIAHEEESSTDQSSINGAEELQEGAIVDQEKISVQEQEDDGDAELEEGFSADQEEEKVQEQEENDVDNADDELKRRIDQFIEKINREWKAEKLRTGRRYRMKNSYSTIINVK